MKPKIKKRKIRNSYRYMNNSNSQNMIQNMKVPVIKNSLTEVPSEQGFEVNFADHQKSTKMLIDCLVKQLNPVTAYVSDFPIQKKSNGYNPHHIQQNYSQKYEKMRKETERSRNDSSSSMFLDVQEKMKGAQNYNHLTCTSNIRARTSHYLNYNN